MTSGDTLFNERIKLTAGNKFSKFSFAYQSAISYGPGAGLVVENTSHSRRTGMVSLS